MGEGHGYVTKHAEWLIAFTPSRALCTTLSTARCLSPAELCTGLRLVQEFQIDSAHFGSESSQNGRMQPQRVSPPLQYSLSPKQSAS